MGEGDCLRAEVTLQVHKVTAVQIPKVLPLEWGEPLSWCPATTQAVETAGHMYGCPRIPVRFVHPHHPLDRVVEIHT